MPPLLANEIWRDFETTGVPASGAHKPIKADIRAWGTALENAGGITAPGAQLVPLFSNGVGVPAVYRPIVGFDLPNPSTTTPGAVFAKPTVAGQVLTGLGADGNFETGTFTATDPHFTGDIYINGLKIVGVLSGSHVMYAPDGRVGIGLVSGGVTNFRASTYNFRNADGSAVFAQINTGANLNTLQLSPPTLTTGQFASAMNITQTWNTDQTVQGVEWRFISQAQGALSNALRIRGGTDGLKNLFFITIGDPTNPALSMNGRTVFAAPDGNANFIYSATGGLSFINAAGGNFLTLISNAGVWNFQGTTSGAHSVAAQAVASGASTLPNTNGELLNTGKGVTFKVLQAGVNMNVANTDNPITFNLPPGCTRFRISSGTVINNGPTASLTTCSYGLFSAAAGGGTAYTPSANLTAITSATPGTANTFTAVATGTLAATMFNTATATVYFRSLVAQGAAVTVDIAWNLEAYP